MAPDSGRLAYEDGLGRIAVVDVETRAVRTLVEGHLPSWSPDGRQIAFLRGFQLFVIDAGGGEPRRVAPGLAASGVAAYEPAWSPDGTRIVFAGGEEDAHNMFPRSSEIHVVGVSDGTVTALTTSRNEKVAPAWSSDGTAIVFAERVRDEPRSELVLIASDGSGRRVLTRPQPLEFDDQPAWSPDGRRLAIAAGPIVLLDPRSGATRELVRGDATHAWPDWQPRCTRLGTARADRLGGTARPDLLCALGGSDRVRGGRGEDRIFGGGGNDRIDARDGAFDVVGCGSGSDTVLADRRDLVGEDCERISR